jgi:uncharacterized protein (TIGR02246 family)
MQGIKSHWYLGTLVSAIFVVGAVSAQPGREDLAMSIPAVMPVSSPVPANIDAAAARAAIEGANAKWLAAFRTGDSESLARIYAPDASLFPPTNASLEGRDSIVEYFGAQRRAGMGDATLKTLDVVCVGDVAYEVGTYGFRFDGGQASVPADAGRYFAIWKSQGDGTWRYQVGIWSSNRDAERGR